MPGPCPILGPVGGDDVVIVAINNLGPTRGFATLTIGGTFRLDHRWGHAKGDVAINVPLATGELPIVVLDSDLVAEESGRACAGVGDQRLILGQLQCEVFTKELGQALGDVFGFGFRSGEPEKGASRRGESRPPALSEPCLNLSAYTAPIVQPPGLRPKRQCANSRGDRREASAINSPARFSRRRNRLYLRMAQRTR